MTLGGWQKVQTEQNKISTVTQKTKKEKQIAMVRNHDQPNKAQQK